MNPSRLKFTHQGSTVYEWEQTLEEVRIFIKTPPRVRAAHLAVDIKPQHLTLGIKGNPPFLDHDFGGVVVCDQSTWTLDNGELEISLQKMKKAETWPSCFKGHEALNSMEEADVKKQMTLERFQQEHPGFDFSGAQFSGSAPDPREFMGGVKYGS